MKLLFDSNILIYAGDPQHQFLRELIRLHLPVVSIVSYIEVLGYGALTDKQRQYFDEFFALTSPIPVTQHVGEKAVTLRQQRKMSLGDSIIAATAIIGKHTLVTRNTDDFKWIAELKLLDPFKQDLNEVHTH